VAAYMANKVVYNIDISTLVFWATRYAAYALREMYACWTVEVKHERRDGDESVPAEQEPDARSSVRRTSTTDRPRSPHHSRRQTRPRRYHFIS